jgi:phytoene synthase
VLAIEADRAREYYKHSEALIPMIEEDSQPALWVLIAIYRALLEKIAARGYDVFHGKIRLTVREKLAILGRGVIRRIT